MTTPQIIISLSPQGELVTELPGLNGSRRKVNLQPQSEFSLAAENAIECIKAFQNYQELENEYNFFASKTTHVGSKEEKEKLLSLEKLNSAKLKLSNANSIISALQNILSQNDTTVGIISKILNGQTANKHQIGEDGNPTEQQVRHWKNHGTLCQDESCKSFQKGINHSHSFSDPSCPHCIGEGRFEKGYNREDNRKLKGLTETEALRLGLISRGFTQSKNNPEIWMKKNMDPIFLSQNGQVKNNKQVVWSKDNRDALIQDGKIHAKQFGFKPLEIFKKKGCVVKKQVTLVKETQAEKLQRKVGRLEF